MKDKCEHEENDAGYCGKCGMSFWSASVSILKKKAYGLRWSFRIWKWRIEIWEKSYPL